VIVTDDIVQDSKDWLHSPHAALLAWWIPHTAIIASLLAPALLRTVIWSAALVWMGTACILNATRCGSTHCRYTGPYYLAMIVPTWVLGFDDAAIGIYGWVIMAGVILLGSKLIWLVTEGLWGKFS
jgi:hypothetical protein